RDWLLESNGFLASSRSREKVRAWFHKLDRARNEAEGKELLDRELRRLGLLGADLAPACERFHLDSVGELYVLVALGDLGPHQIGRLLAEHERLRDAPAPAAPVVQVSKSSGPARPHSDAFTVDRKSTRLNSSHVKI